MREPRLEFGWIVELWEEFEVKVRMHQGPVLLSSQLW